MVPIAAVSPPPEVTPDPLGSATALAVTPAVLTLTGPGATGCPTLLSGAPDSARRITSLARNGA